MLRVLFVLPDLSYSGACKQLTLLAKHLPRDRFATRLCVMGRSGPLARDFQEIGLEPSLLNWHRALDLKPFLEFRRLLREFDPHAIHSWRKGAWKFVCVANPYSLRPFIVSGAEIARGPRAAITLPERLLLRRASYLVAAGKAEANFYAAQVGPARVLEIRPAVETNSLPPPSGLVPAEARVVLCVGPIEATKGYTDAVWAFDLLKCLYQNLHLVIAGDGPDKGRLEQFVRADPKRSDVHFISDCDDLGPLLARADIVWVPGRAERGINLTLEATAASRPVVASRLPAIEEIILEGQTGMLFQPGDRVSLARQTRLLLDNEEKRKRLGEVGKRRAASEFAIESFVSSYADLYQRATKYAEV